MIWIFDLDHTVVDSTHRAIDGVTPSAFLRDWVTHSEEQILADSLLPLGKIMRHLIENDEEVLICTARNMRAADYKLLDNLGINCKVVISRLKGDDRKDADYKYWRLSEYLQKAKILGQEIIFFDDKFEIREKVKTLGITCFDPKVFNGENQVVRIH